MIDINTIITQALNTAIATAVEDRLTALQQAYANAIGELAKRVEALENNPAIGTDTVLEARVMTLETKLTEAKLFEQTTNVTVPIDEKRMVEALNSQEWFWEKVNAYIETGIEDRIERAIDDHLSSYNHDEYDEMHNEWGSESVSEFIKDDDLESQINDALRNASFEVRVTL